jgi:hypothetical protein
MVLTFGAAGCWLEPRLGPGRQNHLGADPGLTAATVAGLVPLWSTPMRSGAATGPVKAPVALDGAVYAVAEVGGFADYGYFAGARFDADTGARRWEALHEAVTLALPMVLDDPVIVDGLLLGRYYVTVADRIVLTHGDAWDLTTGTQRSGGATASSAISPVSGDLALVDGRLAGKSLTQTPPPPTPPDPAVSAVEGWTFRPQVVGAPVLGDWALVGSHGDGSGGIAWSDGGTGATGYLPDCPETFGVPRTQACSPNWTRDLGAAPGDPTDATGDKVVYADASGTVSVLWMSDGDVFWQAEVGGGPLAQPAVADGRILTATADGRLVVLPTGPCDPGSTVCTPSWEGTVGAPGTSVLVVGDVVYVATSAGTIAAFPLAGCGAATCTPLVTVDAGSPISGSPIVFEGKLIAGTADGRVVAFGLPD